MVTCFYLIQNGGMAFNYKSGWLGRHIRRSPWFCQCFTYHFTGVVNPNNTQSKKDKKHVDRRTHLTVRLFHQHQAIVCRQLPPEGKAAQLGAKPIAPARRRNERFAAFFVKNLPCLHNGGKYSEKVKG